jgi:nucleoside 2-deoxyribosyltransferase
MRKTAMIIYFAGSIRGGRNFQSVYQEIISLLQNYGLVLTEHIGRSDLNAAGEADISDNEIYQRDISWIKQADLIVAEVSNPSLGVGYELGLAESLGKNIICLYNQKSEFILSAMISGNNKFKVKTYQNINELQIVFKKIFDEIS